MKRGTIGTIVGGLLLSTGLFALLVSVTFLILGVVFGVTFPAVFGTPFADLQLDRGAATCGGVVEAVEPNPGLRVNGHATVRIQYGYDPGPGTEYGQIVVTDDDPMAAWELGRAVTVEYLPDDPTVSRIQGGKAALAGWAGAMGIGFGAFGVGFTCMALTMVLLGAPLLAWGVRSLRRAAAASG